jgi:hypothetical protein
MECEISDQFRGRNTRPSAQDNDSAVNKLQKYFLSKALGLRRIHEEIPAYKGGARHQRDAGQFDSADWNRGWLRRTFPAMMTFFPEGTDANSPECVSRKGKKVTDTY